MRRCTIFDKVCQKKYTLDQIALSQIEKQVTFYEMLVSIIFTMYNNRIKD